MGKKYSIFMILMILGLNSSFGRAVKATIGIIDHNGINVVTHASNIDFNSDGVIDISILTKSEGQPVWPNSFACGNPSIVFPSGAVEYSIQSAEVSVLGLNAGYYSGTGNPLASNLLIGPATTYSSSITQGGLRSDMSVYLWGYSFSSNCYSSYAQFPTKTVTGNWNNGGLSDGYLGVKFTIQGKVHYGYIKFTAYNSMMPHYSTVSVSEAFYESIPGFPIKTGDKVGYMSDPFNPTANIIKGKVYLDKNNNCSYDAGDVVVPNVMLSTSTGNYAGITDQSGNYEIYVQGGTASYDVSIDTGYHRREAFVSACPVSGSLTISFTGNNQTSLNKNFAITGASSRLSVEVFSDRRRRCFRNNTTVVYQNQGFNVSSSATVYVVLPQYVKAISSTPAWNRRSGDTLVYNVGTVNPISTRYIYIVDSVVCGNEQIRDLVQCTQAIITPHNQYTGVAGWDQSDLFVKGICNNSVFATHVVNKGSNMADSVVYRVFLDGTLVKTKKIKLSQNQIYPLNIPTNGKAFRIEVDQATAHPEIVMRSLNYEGCGNFATDVITKNTINRYPTDQGGLTQACNCLPIRDSYDPNDKQAIPAGDGNEHRILPNGDIEYTIRFQNTGSDEAYTVVVADTLDTNIDLGSFRTIAASHSYKVEVTGKINPRIVWIFGGINLPDSTTNEPASHGFITYRVSQKPGLSNGTALNNKAHIFFDYNAAIITNNVQHKIGLVYPVDTLKAIPQNTTQQQCGNTSLSVASSGTGYGTLQYQWFKNGNSLSSQTSSSLNISNATASDAGNYRCRIDNKIDTIYTSPVVVSIHPTPSLIITDPNISCTDVNITNTFLDNNSTTGTVSYWKNANATVAVSSASSLTESGTYYIKKETSLGCSDIKPVQVTIAQAPQLTVSNPDASCFPVDITQAFTDVNGSTGTVSYWTNVDATATLTTPTLVSQSGTYYIKKVVTAGCEDIEPIQVTINTIPQLTITNPGATCSTVSLVNTYTDANATTGTVSYWKDANATVAVTTPAAVAVAGTYYIRKVTSQGCEDIKTVEVTLLATPGLNITDPAAACTSVDITGTFSDLNTTTGTVSYWQDANATLQLINPASVAQSGTYYIKKETPDGCVDIKPVDVEVTVCSATQEMFERYGIRIYPNPVVDKLTVDHQEAQQVLLYDSKGTIVANKQLSSNKEIIDMKTMPSGTYHLIVQKGDQLYSTQIVKE